MEKGGIVCLKSDRCAYTVSKGHNTFNENALCCKVFDILKNKADSITRRRSSEARAV